MIASPPPSRRSNGAVSARCLATARRRGRREPRAQRRGYIRACRRVLLARVRREAAAIRLEPAPGDGRRVVRGAWGCRWFSTRAIHSCPPRIATSASCRRHRPAGRRSGGSAAASISPPTIRSKRTSCTGTARRAPRARLSAPTCIRSTRSGATAISFCLTATRPAASADCSSTILNEGGFERCFAFMRSVGDHFLPAFLPIVERRQT